MMPKSDTIFQDLDKNTQPIISVNVITYNQEKYIAQTIESILAQKTIYKYELIIADDHSTDATLAVCLDYFHKYPNIIRVVSNNPNKGLMRNYHETVGLSRGKYIASIAGDDWWCDTEKLQKQVEFLENHPDYGMVCGQVLLYKQENEEYCYLHSKSGAIGFYDLMIENCIAACTVCYRKQLFDSYMDEINPVSRGFACEDYPLWIWFSRNSKIYKINEPLSTYRLLPDSLSHFTSASKKLKFEKDILHLRQFFLDYYKITDYSLIHDVYLRYHCSHMFEVVLSNDEKLYKEAKVFFKNNKYNILHIFLLLYKSCLGCNILFKGVRGMQSIFNKFFFKRYLRLSC